MNDKRLFDLVRYMRMDLFEKGLITEAEYSELAKDHASVDRLETYDGLRAERDRMRDGMSALLRGCK